jgi:hypothetical protein
MTCTNASATKTGRAVRPESPIPPPNRKSVYRRFASNCKLLYRLLRPAISPTEIANYKIDHRQREQAAVHAVQPAAVAGEQISAVLDACTALHRRFA